jgi:hypothetical protein
MESCLRCSVSPGQFSGEYAISASQSNGEPFSLFADEELVDIDGGNGPGEGWLRVEVMDRRGEDVLVRLPSPSLEGGQFVTVRSNQLSARCVPTSPR